MIELSRSLTRVNATAMVAGTIIGASIFVQPSEIARHLDSPLAIMLAWAACGVLTLFGAFVCAELASAFPQTGGVYVFLRETFSPLAGFLWGWAMFWSVHSGIIAAIAVVFGRYASLLLPASLQGDTTVRALAVAVIAASVGVNYFGVRAGGRVQTLLTDRQARRDRCARRRGISCSSAPVSQPTPPPGTRDGLTPVPARHGGGPLRLWRLAHGHLHRGRNDDARAHDSRGARRRGRDRDRLLHAMNLVYLRVLSLEQVRASTRIAADAADVIFGRGGAHAPRGPRGDLDGRFV